MTALVAQGYSYAELVDYDNGPPLEVLLALNVQAARFSLEEEKRQVNGLGVALASLFKGDILTKYYNAIDKILDETNLTGSGAEVEVKTDRRMKASAKNLSKLSELLGNKVGG